MSLLDFEKPIAELQAKIEELKNFGSDKKIELNPEIERLEKKLQEMRQTVYGNLTTWQRIQIARHPDRPYTLDYIRMLTTDFVEVHGDRLYSDDKALITGLAQIGGRKVVVMGHQKGRDTNENVMRNFGCAHPEGYRKASRLFKMAEKFKLPVVIFIDTPGAYPGIGAEERGQAQAIAENLKEMAMLKTPIFITIIGEGGSGGALGVGIGDKVCMLEHAYYSVISPEGCASILWRNSVKAPDAAEALKITSEHLLRFGIVDHVFSEPMGGAHNDPELVVNQMKEEMINFIDQSRQADVNALIESRYQKFRKIGEYLENPPA